VHFRAAAIACRNVVATNRDAARQLHGSAAGLDSRSLSVRNGGMTRRRYPPPWKVEENRKSFVVADALGQKLAYIYFEDEPTRQSVTERIGKERCLAASPRDHADSDAVAAGLS
jgi:hypothetical protein